MVRRELTGARLQGVAIERLSLTNRNGIRLDAISYGGIITSLVVPDRSGMPGDIVLGFDDAARYGDTPLPPYFGAIIGRYANRIARGQFTLDGRTYTLPINDPPNSLHGGVRGFDKRVWLAETRKVPGAETVKFTRVSGDGEEGYPGSVELRVSYTLRDSNELVVEYRAITSAPTPINLTQHTYFNLSAGTHQLIIRGREANTQLGRLTVSPFFAITNLVRPANGNVTVTGSGVANATCVLQAVSSLTPPLVWTSISTNVSDGQGRFSCSDPASTSFPSRFYRVLGR